MQDNIQIRTLTNWFQHQTGFNHCILDELWYDPVKLSEIKKPTKLLNQKFKTEVEWLTTQYSSIMNNGAELKNDVLLDYLYIGQYDDDDVALLLCINNEMYDIRLMKHIIEENKGKIDFIFPYNPTENMYMYLSGTMIEPCKYQLYYVNKKILIDNKYIISGNNMSLIKETMGKLNSAIKDERVDFAIVDIRNKKVCVEETTYIYHPEANSLTLEA